MHREEMDKDKGEHVSRAIISLLHMTMHGVIISFSS